MTNRELARWCNLMLGEVCVGDMISTAYTYPRSQTHNLVPPGVKIRPWGSDLWIDPTTDKPQYEGHTI